MSESPELPDSTNPRRRPEYQDFHFHDEDDVPADEDCRTVPRQPLPRKPSHRLPPRRRHEDD